MREILIIDTDEARGRGRGDQLLMDGFEVQLAGNRQRAESKLAEAPDAVVLSDLGTPHDTLRLLRELRAGEIPSADARVPVLAVGADDDSQALRYYRAGADIALPSTSSPLLMAAGLDALARRVEADGQSPRQLQVGSLSIDCDARVAQINHQPIKLTRLEFDLLQALASQPQRVFTRAELTQEIWGYDPAAAGNSRTLSTHSTRLRHKLHEAGAQNMVQPVRGVGLKLTS